MDDLWHEQDNPVPPPIGGRIPTPDMDDLWDANPQRQFTYACILFYIEIVMNG